MMNLRIVPCSVLSGLRAQIESKHGAMLVCWKMHKVCSCAVYSFLANKIDKVSEMIVCAAK